MPLQGHCIAKILSVSYVSTLRDALILTCLLPLNLLQVQINVTKDKAKKDSFDLAPDNDEVDRAPFISLRRRGENTGDSRAAKAIAGGTTISLGS